MTSSDLQSKYERGELLAPWTIEPGTYAVVLVGSGYMSKDGNLAGEVCEITFFDTMHEAVKVAETVGGRAENYERTAEVFRAEFPTDATAAR